MSRSLPDGRSPLATFGSHQPAAVSRSAANSSSSRVPESMLRTPEAATSTTSPLTEHCSISTPAAPPRAASSTGPKTSSRSSLVRITRSTATSIRAVPSIRDADARRPCDSNKMSAASAAALPCRSSKLPISNACRGSRPGVPGNHSLPSAAGRCRRSAVTPWTSSLLRCGVSRSTPSQLQRTETWSTVATGTPSFPTRTPRARRRAGHARRLSFSASNCHPVASNKVRDARSNARRWTGGRCTTITRTSSSNATAPNVMNSRRLPVLMRTAYLPKLPSSGRR
jgi:hypothetical protein